MIDLNDPAQRAGSAPATPANEVTEPPQVPSFEEKERAQAALQAMRQGGSKGKGATSEEIKKRILASTVRGEDVAFKPDQPYLIKGLLYRDTQALLYGQSRAGKSFIALDMMMHIAAGRSWCGMRVKEPMKVVYIAAEGGEGFEQRFFTYSCTDSDLYNAAKANVTIVKCAVNLMQKDEVQAVIDLFAGETALYVFDTFSRSTAGGDEKEVSDLNVVLDNLDDLNRPLNACSLIIHHDGKDTSKGPRGTSGFIGNFNAVIKVSGHVLKGVRVTTDKVKDGRDDLEFLFKSKSAIIGQDSDSEFVSGLTLHYEPSVDPKELHYAKIKVVDSILAALHYAGTEGLTGQQIVEAADLTEKSFRNTIKEVLTATQRFNKKRADRTHDGGSVLKSHYNIAPAGSTSHEKNYKDPDPETRRALDRIQAAVGVVLQDKQERSELLSGEGE